MRNFAVTDNKPSIQRAPAEQDFADELAALAKADTRQKPPIANTYMGNA